MSDFYKNLGSRIRYYRTLSNMSLEELGNRIGVGKSTVRKYEVGTIKVSHKRMEQLAAALGIDVALLFGEELSGEVVDVPLYGGISCGDGSVIYESTEEYITTPKEWVKDNIYLYLTAIGDSMVGARIHEGDLLLIKKQIDLENGEIGAVVIDDECVLKRVYKNNDTFTLISENPKYPPIEFDPKSDQNIRIIGKLVKSITRF